MRVLIFLAGLCVLAIAARHIPFSVCLFRNITDMPCPFCGGIRSVTAFGTFHWAESLSLNPLVFAGCLTALIFGAMSWVWPMFQAKMKRVRWFRIFLLALPLNWIYLMLAARFGLL